MYMSVFGLLSVLPIGFLGYLIFGRDWTGPAC